MYTNEAFRSDCLALFNETEGNIVDVPGTGETVLFEELIIGFASADDEIFEPFTRSYAGVYDYCIRCGACMRNCPANAISLKHGKNNIKCNRHVETMKKKYSPRYGCGKCQVGVPCEARAPKKTKGSD